MITQDPTRSPELSELLRARGFELEPISVLDFKLPGSPSSLDDKLKSLDRFDYVIFTSVNTVRFLMERLTSLQLRDDHLAGRTVVSIGPATSRALRDAGINVPIEPTRSNSQGILAAMRERPRGRILLPQSDLAPEVLLQGLRAIGFAVERVVAYVTRPNSAGVALVRRRLVNQDLTALVVTSPSAFRAIAEGDEAHAQALGQVPLVAIGERTAEAIHDMGYRVAHVTAEPTAAGISSSLEELLADRL